MSRRGALALLLLLRGLAPDGGGAATVPIRCPDTLTVSHRPEAPSGWTADPATAQHPFERISIFNGRMGEQHKEAPVELAPDEEVRKDDVRQTWQLGSNGDEDILLVCRYAATRAAVALHLPPSVRTCEQTLPKGGDEPPPTMVCR